MGDLNPDQWFKAVTADDLRLQGVDIGDGETAPQAVERLADEMGVDLPAVGRCLVLLRSGRCMLSGGSPMAMLSYSPRRGVYRAAYDGDCAADLSSLSVTSAGVWLTLLSGEIGSLPDAEDHWLIARFAGGGVVASNRYVSDLATDYARQVDVPQIRFLPSEHGSYERLLGRAFWRCATHCLR
ncbi:hypothetical protein RQP53_14330 [Paucibacter sp. APW11]|uniref:Uncharacterized protein n=1 Tax=Roseateles aquae TaxID=3077235 RepID=A0ABU3PD36_9BURK|nr:hypothetical protein [Paucibacter sp. APW11]MDT9000449.1 hypothetical protein [Paucibacter sp. APW11]